MKAILLFTLLFAAICVHAQTSAVKKEPVPDYIQITPDFSRAQIDSVIGHLKQWNIELSFETLEYDPATNMIVSASGKVINSYFPSNIAKATFNSSEFQGLTIKTTKEETGIMVGIIPVPEKK